MASQFRPLSFFFSGFTSLELLVAIAIVGLLVRVAYPFYQSYVLKARTTLFSSIFEPYRYLMRDAARNLDSLGDFSSLARGITLTIQVDDTTSLCSISTYASVPGQSNNQLNIYYNQDGTQTSSSYGNPAGINTLKQLVSSIPCPVPHQSQPYIQFSVTRSIGASNALQASSGFYFTAGMSTDPMGFGGSTQQWDAFFQDNTGLLPLPDTYDYFTYDNSGQVRPAIESVNQTLKSPSDPYSACQNWKGFSLCP